MVARYSLVLDGAAIKELPVGDTLAGQATSGANADITSLTGLTTALSASQGGTGLTSAGTAGNVLTSTGSGWSSGAAPSSNGGATTTSSAVDITLTAASNRVQAVTMTAASLSVTLPVATTLTTGGALFVIRNYGTNAFAVRNSAGTLLAPVAVGQIISLYLSDNTTAAGVWAVGNESTASFLSEILNGSTLAVSSIAANATAICGLSATQAVVVYAATGGTMRARTLNISGTTMTAGAELNIGAGDYYIDMIAMSATQALVCSAGTGQDCYTLNVSGTTITAGAVLNAGPSGTRRGLAKLSTTRAIIAYTSSGNVAVRTLNISGTTITANTAYVSSDASSAMYGIAALSATEVIVIWNNASGFLIRSIYTIGAGGEVTASGYSSNVNSVDTVYINIAALTATTALLVYVISSTNAIEAVVCSTIGGGQTTLGTKLNTGLSGSWLVSATVTANKVLACYSNGAGFTNLMFTINGTTVTASPAYIVNSIAGNYSGLASLSANKSIMSFKNSASTFTNATLIETAL